MGDIGEMFNYHNDASKVKRANNREWSANYLEQRGIEFESKNCGAHLIVKYNDKIADFWPGTGKFNIRGGSGYFRGVKNLVKRLEGGE